MMIALITATGGRPRQFQLCEKFMQRQTYKDDVVWIIVDDVIPPTTNLVGEEFKPKWTIIKVYPMPAWRVGQNTQARNLNAGMRVLTDNFKKKDISAVFIIEDDDWYRPNYLEKMVDHLKGYDIAGEKNCIYYNVQYRRYVRHDNIFHSSLFQTAFVWDEIPRFSRICDNPSKVATFYIDVQMWHEGKRKNLFNDGNLGVGIKGMPGRLGIGAGHSKWLAMYNDPDLNYLRSIIGDDAQLYEGFDSGERLQQHKNFNRERIR
jgi:hypothetical protein